MEPVIKVLEEKHRRVVIVILIPTRVGSEPRRSQWLDLCIGPCWPRLQPQEGRPLSKAVVSKKKGVCAPGDVQGNSLGVKEEKIRISICVSLNLKIKTKSSFSNI